MMRRQAYQFQLRPKVRHRKLFAQFAGSCRLVWNKALALQKACLDEKQKTLGYAELCKALTKWKAAPETSFLALVHSQPLQQTLKNLDRALKEAFDRSNPKQFPVFKKKGRRDSFHYPQGFKVDQANSRVYLPKIGWIRYRNSQAILGTPKNVTVSKRGDDWHVSIQTEREVEAPTTLPTSIVGGDLGIVRFLTLSNGEYFEPKNSFRSLEKKLARLQRTLSRRIKGSNNWRSAKHKLTQLHIRIANVRNDYLHKLSHYLSQNHAVVVLEDLKVSNMSRSASGTIEAPGKNVAAKSGLNKSILDQGWYEFRRQLGYKLSWLGGLLVLVNPKNTSRCCLNCGHTSGENRLTQAKFLCVECGYNENADLVGALNILRAGHALIACGDIGFVGSLAQEPSQLIALV